MEFVTFLLLVVLFIIHYSATFMLFFLRNNHENCTSLYESNKGIFSNVKDFSKNNTLKLLVLKSWENMTTVLGRFSLTILIVLLILKKSPVGLCIYVVSIMIISIISIRIFDKEQVNVDESSEDDLTNSHFQKKSIFRQDYFPICVVMSSVILPYLLHFNVIKDNVFSMKVNSLSEAHLFSFAMLVLFISLFLILFFFRKASRLYLLLLVGLNKYLDKYPNSHIVYFSISIITLVIIFLLPFF